MFISRVAIGLLCVVLAGARCTHPKVADGHYALRVYSGPSCTGTFEPFQDAVTKNPYNCNKCQPFSTSGKSAMNDRLKSFVYTSGHHYGILFFRDVNCTSDQRLGNVSLK
ncbi:hypothetical protein BV22DRAFT_1030709 [Leucogyrophana mollusca]|uniref:Uncharacterized protein n=1 Tax=Leucogyrophana mollusca TaxID=85980 RepID=A0ACB8BRY4_9AGAM|nr:hypothetical protein BV22DRAFT_1030709 [Leucogyrophana mollusca]